MSAIALDQLLRAVPHAMRRGADLAGGFRVTAGVFAASNLAASTAPSRAIEDV